MIPLAFALAGLVGAAILVVAHAVRLGRRSTSRAVANVAAYGYGATAPVTTARQASAARATSAWNARSQTSRAG